VAVGNRWKMTLTCPDCGKPFFLEVVYIAMLKDSIKVNPNLKIICGKCGKAIIKRYEVAR
jgi:RNase P subunit RPR2